MKTEAPPPRLTVPQEVIDANTDKFLRWVRDDAERIEFLKTRGYETVLSADGMTLMAISKTDRNIDLVNAQVIEAELDAKIFGGREDQNKPDDDLYDNSDWPKKPVFHFGMMCPGNTILMHRLSPSQYVAGGFKRVFLPHALGIRQLARWIVIGYENNETILSDWLKANDVVTKDFSEFDLQEETITDEEFAQMIARVKAS